MKNKRKKTGYAISMDNLIGGSVLNTKKEIDKQKFYLSEEDFYKWLKEKNITILNNR